MIIIHKTPNGRTIKYPRRHSPTFRLHNINSLDTNLHYNINSLDTNQRHHINSQDIILRHSINSQDIINLREYMLLSECLLLHQIAGAVLQ